METFEVLESNVRTYCHLFPTVFNSAYDCYLENEKGDRYLDFFCGAGTLNYGHNHPIIKKALLEYIEGDGICHSLDMATTAKRNFLETFNTIILKPRKLNYKVQFTGPTGTNAVEAALKLARKVTGRSNVIAFTNAYHGVTLGSLAATGNSSKRRGAGIPLNNVTFMPYDGYFGKNINTLECIEKLLNDPSSGIDKPAAFILETIQAEGGINEAGSLWLEELQKLIKKYDALMIIDDIQAGCGRTGTFFSFENTNIYPDIICLSKSLSGYGLPFSIVLSRPNYDLWEPGEHNGTFRGNNLAFVSATECLKYFWTNNEQFIHNINTNSILLKKSLQNINKYFNLQSDCRGRGLIQGVEWQNKNMANKISQRCFERKLIIEPVGSYDQVLKFLPPLTISSEKLKNGLDILYECIEIELQPRSMNNFSTV